jgi:hypothetical protein
MDVAYLLRIYYSFLQSLRCLLFDFGSSLCNKGFRAVEKRRYLYLPTEVVVNLGGWLALSCGTILQR